ncbi:hypothetical protein QAD02_021689 [Eretmocerus hayati]|uniref:Uncharacterized protein n=1 Tax=Eretmocerus hayati TaxID=131215 RepID=A0ACC2PQX0_9HYME|nr:hypothetical protein QAD02_021689 [Eretmocerus hayati]
MIKERFEELSNESAYYFIRDPETSPHQSDTTDSAEQTNSSSQGDPISEQDSLESRRRDFALSLYWPHKKATKSENSINAGGSLYDKYLNNRKTLIRIGVIPKKDILEEDLVPQGQENALAIVRKGNRPQKVVTQYWDLTLPIRGPPKDVKSYFQLYAPLGFTYGYLLWSSDYDHTHPNGPEFQVEFNSIIPFIIEIAKEKNKFDDSLELLESRGQDHLAALLSLPKVLGIKRLPEKQANGKGSKRKKAGAGAPKVTVKLPATFGSEVKDISDSFIYNASTPLDFAQFKEKRKRDSEKNGRPIGPFITLVGDYKDEGTTAVVSEKAQRPADEDRHVEVAAAGAETEDPADGDQNVEVFVTVNFVDYEIPSNCVLDAVNYCYKSFSALKIEYPVECRPVWKFLHYYIYKNDWDSVKRGSAIKKFIDDINLRKRTPESIQDQSANAQEPAIVIEEILVSELRGDDIESPEVVSIQMENPGTSASAIELLDDVQSHTMNDESGMED